LDTRSAEGVNYFKLTLSPQTSIYQPHLARLIYRPSSVLVGAMNMPLTVSSAFTVGIIEGLAESTALIVKVFSGALSDYLGKRKGLAVFGYALGALTKPLFAVASGTGIVITARLLDRVGKGIRGAPRDALVAPVIGYLDQVKR
jgi:hypothetical protein